MNLYKIMFDHYAPKDSQRGLITYLLANNDEEVYEWIKSEPSTNVGNIYNSWKYYEEEQEFDIYNDDFDVIGTENFKVRMLRLGGEMFDEDADVSDAYYGVTHLGWEVHKENINEAYAKILLDLGVASSI